MLFLVIAIAALIIGSIFMFRGSAWYIPAVNPILAILTSVSAGGFIWLITVKLLEAEATAPTHNLEKLIGDIGEARSDIHHEGSVYVGGETWTARSQTYIPANSRVQVIARDGFILEVEKIEGEE
jgi:membrane-bound serine protease (ClpP class)